MSLNRQGGAGIGLNLNYTVPVPGVTFPATVGAGPITLQGGNIYMLPAGQYWITPGPYTLIQTKDPVTGLWRAIPTSANAAEFVTSDGANVRLANLTGCALGAVVTNVGSGYTSAPSVTAPGGSLWQAIIGGAIASSLTIGSAGSGYTYPPQIIISPPPVGGVQATATATLSGSTVNAVTCTDQGAGYITAPTVTVLPDPRETSIPTAAVVTTAITGSGTITAILCTNHGNAQTSVPTLTISGGGGASGAATAVMCFAATGIGSVTGGAGYGNAQPFGVLTGGGQAPAGSTVLNPSISNGLLTPRNVVGTGTTTAGGAITATGFSFIDAGLFSAVPTAFILVGGNGLVTGAGQATVTVGGIKDVTFIQPW